MWIFCCRNENAFNFFLHFPFPSTNLTTLLAHGKKKYLYYISLAFRWILSRVMSNGIWIFAFIFILKSNANWWNFLLRKLFTLIYSIIYNWIFTDVYLANFFYSSHLFSKDFFSLFIHIFIFDVQHFISTLHFMLIVVITHESEIKKLFLATRACTLIKLHFSQVCGIWWD